MFRSLKCLKLLVSALNQERALVGAFSVRDRKIFVKLRLKLYLLCLPPGENSQKLVESVRIFTTEPIKLYEVNLMSGLGARNGNWG